MPTLQTIDSGVVYINPQPGYLSNFACHSHVVQLSDRELLCTFQRGQALYSLDSVLVQARSTNGGKTWGEYVLLHDPRGEHGSYSYHGPFLTRLADGTLLMNAIRWDRSDPDKPLFNETTGGILPADTVLLRCADDSATWSKPQKLAIDDGRILTPSGPVVELKNGTWMLPCDQWHHFDELGPYKPLTVGLFSSDGGNTWDDSVTFADGSGAGKGHWHGRIIRLRDDRLFGMFWTADMKSGAALPLHTCVGSPEGRDWSTPRSTNIPGQTNWAVDLGSNRMVAIFTVRDAQPPGFFAVFSEDGGTTWDLDRKIHVWDTTGRDKIGVNAPDDYPRSHDTISFGAPNAIVLADGDV